MLLAIRTQRFSHPAMALEVRLIDGNQFELKYMNFSKIFHNSEEGDTDTKPVIVIFDGRPQEWRVTLSVKSDLTSGFLTLQTCPVADVAKTLAQTQCKLKIASSLNSPWIPCEKREEDFVCPVISHKELLNSPEGYMPNHKLVILFEINFIQDITVFMPDRLPSNYETFYSRELFSDVVIQTSEGKSLKAHKIILAAQNPVFAAMFSTNMQEAKSGIVKVDDVTNCVMDIMLFYLYSEKVKHDLKGIALEVFVAADKYGIEGLKHECLKAMMKELAVDNAVELLIFAENYAVENLKMFVLNFITNNYNKVSLSNSWKKLDDYDETLKKEVLSNEPKLVSVAFD